MKIQFENFVIGYKNNTLIEPINLIIKSGQWVGIFGDNGLGKSTLLKSIIGITRPLSGNILVNNMEVKKNIDSIGYFPQEKDLNINDCLSGYSLIKNSFQPNKWGLPIFNCIVKNKINSLSQLTEISDYIKKPFNILSGGQKKKIMLAQVLINSPKLILLDEPLSQLDKEYKIKFMTILKKQHMANKFTLLIISHEKDDIINMLDCIINFDEKKINYEEAV